MSKNYFFGLDPPNIVCNDFIPQLNFTPAADWGTHQLFSSSYPTAMHANSSALLRVKTVIIGTIFW